MIVQWYAVGFFDLMGQSDLMKQLVLKPGDRMDGEYARKYVELVAPVEQQRHLFERAMAGAKSRWNDYVPPTQLEPNVREALVLLLKQQIQMHAFSDSIVLWTPLSVGTLEPQVAGLLEMISSAAMVTLSLLAARTTLRGAITVNAGSVLPSGAFYGPVLGEAVDAEKKADWPRVVVDGHALSFLNQAREGPTDTPLRMANRHVADECASLILRCADGLTMVDSFGPKFVGKPGDPVRESQDFRNGIAWLRAELGRFKAGGNTKLFEKYRKLLSHVDARMQGLDRDDLKDKPGCLS